MMKNEITGIKKNKEKTSKVIGNILVHIGLGILAFIWVLPILWVIMTSFRAGKGSYSTTFIPQSWTLSNYTTLLTDTDIFNFPRWFGNTLFVAIISCILATFYLVSIAFVMSRLRFKARKPMLNVALILGMFPGFMSMIAVYYILKGIGLTQGNLKLVALILLYSGGASILQFYVAKGFFDTIPKTIDEAAYIDGATKWDVFTKITIPLAKPIIVYTVLTSFMAPWIDFIMAKVIIGTDAQYYTVAIGLWNMLEKENIYQWYTRFAAGAVLVSIPIAILFVIMQRYYTDGMSGAVKG
ncbi:MAG: sugar ABC transporter permease [Lachnospiraceae bacterium]|nr:sugar ABC transporter permease [Lachnospiraceae bacterium]HCJ07697.1 sugar ABC transporter permease [Lachnospiraceae bacterium]